MTSIETWTKLHRRIMQWVYDYFTEYVLNKKGSLKEILLYIIEQYFNILRHLAGEISHLQCDAYRVILTGASDLKLFVDSVYKLQ